MAQVVLALQLPFVLVPLIKATSSKRLMGPHRNSTLLAAAAWASCGLVFVANLGLFVSELWPGAALVPHVEPEGRCGPQPVAPSVGHAPVPPPSMPPSPSPLHICGLGLVANLGLFVSKLWPGVALHVEPEAGCAACCNMLVATSFLVFVDTLVLKPAPSAHKHPSFATADLYVQ